MADKRFASSVDFAAPAFPKTVTFSMALALEALGKDIQQDTIIPVCFQLVLRSEMGPGCVKTFFLPQKLYATGDDPHRHDGLSIFLLYRVRSQPGRKLGPR